MLASYHNLFFLHQLTLDSRLAIGENRFVEFKNDFLRSYLYGGSP
jgi:queuine tRNA-ribosyltransferase